MVERAAGLAGCRVWVTRPREQAAGLCALIRAAGGEPVNFPLVEIVVAPAAGTARALLAGIRPGDTCIFVSRNAVRLALELAPPFVAALGTCRVFAVGAGTAAELARHGIAATAGPGPAYGTADLLTLPDLQDANLRGHDVFIVRGAGGEPTLAQTLTARGARVQCAEVYQRARPEPDPAATETLWRTASPDIMVLTSAEAVATLVALTPPARQARLLATALVVISSRVASAARNAGFAGTVQVATGATDTGLLEALLAWRTPR